MATGKGVATGGAATGGCGAFGGATGGGLGIEGGGGDGWGTPPSTNAFPHFGQFTFEPAAKPADFIVPWQCGQAIFAGELAVDMDERFPQAVILQPRAANLDALVFVMNCFRLPSGRGRIKPS